MRSTHRGRLGSIILACLFLSSVLAQENQTRSTTASDDAALRALVEEFYGSYAKKDLDGFLRLWSAKSPEFAARRETTRKLFTGLEKIEVKGVVIRKIAVEGEKAKLRVELEMDAIEVKTGKPAAGFGKMIRSWEAVKEEGIWKVWHETSAEEDLAAALQLLKTDDERSALLTAEKELVTEGLVRELNRQGNSLRVQGNYPEALARFRLMQNIAEQIGDKADIGRALNNMGFVYFLQSDFTLALEHCQKSLAIFEAIGNKPGAANALGIMGNAQYLQGNYTLALENYLKSLSISEALGDQAGIYRAIGSIGNVHDLQGNYARALEYYQKSLAMSEMLGDKGGIYRALGSIGNIHLLQGNYAQALEYYQKTLATSEALGDKPGISETLTNLGGVYASQGNYAQALEYYQKSLAMREALGDKSGIANTMLGIGQVHVRQGNYAQALEHFQKSLALGEALGDQDVVTRTLIERGNTSRLQGNYSQALDFAGRATVLAKQFGYPIEFSRAQNDAGQAYRALNQLVPARQAFEEAIATIETLRSQVAGGEQDQQRFFENSLDPYHAMVELLVAQNQANVALAYAERAKARVLLDVLHSGRINVNKAMTAAEQEQERGFNNRLISLNTQISRENQGAQSDPVRLNDLKAQLQKARLDYEAFQTSLYAAHPELKAQRGEVEPLTPEQARALLPDPHSALLEYVVTEDRTYLFALTGNDARTMELKVYTLTLKQKELGARVAQFRETLANGSSGFRAPARELYDLLLKPASAQLQGRTSLIIVPDGALWELPFQALQPTPTRYLIEDSAIAYAPSLTALREMNKLRERKKDSTDSLTLLAFANPALGKQTVTRVKSVLMDEKLDPLPEAERQVNAIKQIYGAPKTKVYIGEEAREERAKAEAGSYRILQFATHGILNDSSPMYSQLLLAQSEADTREDGLLEAWEIMKLDLKADLVVLSACDTARGRVGAGEGMIGLSWAFFVAGSPTSVLSQWKVDSASTTELMVEFHRQLKAQMTNSSDSFSAARALREADLKLLRSERYRHPFYWAGFVVTGKGF